MLPDYYSLIKPGIVYGNALTAAAGFLLASRGHVNLPLLVVTLAGICAVMASGCVFNNYIDRDIDAVMERTKDRALPGGRVAPRAALFFGALLCLLGALLLWAANVLALLAALFGLFVYVGPYSLWSKRHSVWATIVGAVAGAVPPVVGYAAAGDRLDAGAYILFAVLFFWQLPHSFAIGVFRLEDYRAAGVPVLPAAHGVRAAKWATLWSVAAFAASAGLLPFFGYVGGAYVLLMGALCLWWLFLAWRGFFTADDRRWGRTMFFYSLAILLAFCAVIPFGPLMTAL